MILSFIAENALVVVVSAIGLAVLAFSAVLDRVERDYYDATEAANLLQEEAFLQEEMDRYDEWYAAEQARVAADNAAWEAEVAATEAISDLIAIIRREVGPEMDPDDVREEAERLYYGQL